MKRFSCVRGRRAVALTTFVCILALAVACLSGPGRAVGAAASDAQAPPAIAGLKSPARKPARTAVARAAEARAAVARAAAVRTAPAAALVAAAKPVAAARGRAGMVVGIDPASGELGPPTADQIQAMQADSDPTLDRSTEGLEMITLADGSQRVNLQGRFRAFSVLTLGADGTARVECVEGRVPALALARAGAPPTSPAHTPRAAVGPREE